MSKWLVAGQLGIVAVMFASAAVVWPVAPESIPVHWSLAGRVDRYVGKLEGLVLLPVVTLLLVLALRLLPRIDPQRRRYAEFAGAYAAAGLAVVAFLAGVHALVLAWALDLRVNVGVVLAALVGLLLSVLGSLLGQVRPNWFFGIRTPWTLSSERSWTATHRLGRWVLLVMGLAIGLAGLVQAPWAWYLVVARRS